MEQRHVLHLLLAVAALALLVVLLTLPEATLAPVDCNDEQPCTADLRSRTTGLCKHEAYPRSHACNDSCVTGGHCDGAGACTGGTCHGTCSDDFDGCEDAIVFDPRWWNTDTPFCGIPVLWELPISTCFAGRCDGYVVETYALALFDPVPIYLSALFECQDYLDADFRAAHGSCIRTERHLLDMNMTQYLAEEEFGFPDFPVQFAVCTYHFACGAMDPTQLEDIMPAAAASATGGLLTSGTRAWHMNTTLTDILHCHFLFHPCPRAHLPPQWPKRVVSVHLSLPRRQRQARNSRLSKMRCCRRGCPMAWPRCAR